MNREIGKQKSNGTIKKLSINPQMVCDESAIANAFCDYFAEATSFSPPEVKNDNILNNANSLSSVEMKETPITVAEILSAIRNHSIHWVEAWEQSILLPT
jgi:hypothetical protein